MNDNEFNLAIANKTSVSFFMNEQKIKLNWWNFPFRIVIDAKAPCNIREWKSATITAKFSEC